VRHFIHHRFCLSLVTMALLGFVVLVAVQSTRANPGLAIVQDDQRDQELLRSRYPAARADKTIFSPLDLPTPNRMRTASGLPGEDYWQQQVDYRIEVSLDVEIESVTATAHVTYTNNSPQDLPYLWISLEQNLFRPDSDGSRFAPPGSRFDNRPGFEGGIDIGYVRTGDTNLKLAIHDTVGRIDLAEPVRAKGGTTEFDISWSFRIPDYGADRMGIRRCEQGNIYQLAQWFPAVCKFDDVHGWNTLPYLGQGEFFTDFGSYDVKITAPRGHVVCATGVLRNAEEVLSEKQLRRLIQANTSRQTVMIRSAREIGTEAAAKPGEGPLTWHFQADKVRTFAWTSSDATIWDAASVIQEDGKTTLVQSVYPTESRTAWRESTQMLKHSIEHYNKKWFPYPYPTATNVSGIVGGMEYPMIIFCMEDTDPEGLHMVTSHEIGHNWFPMVVNTDERRAAWMDEGFNTFMNSYDRYDIYEAEVNGGEMPDEDTGFNARNMARLMSRPNVQPLALPADQIHPDWLGMLAYYKTATAMQMLREVVLGPDRFDPAFREYIRAWAFKSPQPADFFRCMENGTGTELAWYWRGWFLENIPLDQAIVDVDQSIASGLARITIANHREMVMPVSLEIEFTNGETLEHKLPVHVWYYTNLWTADVEIGDRTIQQVVIDPNRVMPDLNRRNNKWTAPKKKDAAAGPDDGSKQDGDGNDNGDGNSP